MRWCKGSPPISEDEDEVLVSMIAAAKTPFMISGIFGHNCIAVDISFGVQAGSRIASRMAET